MRRRSFITLLGSAAAWPLAARAQQAGKAVIGFLYAGAPEPIAHLLAAFRKGLAETGYAEGQNVDIEFRWARNQVDRLSEFAADLVARRVTVIVAPGSITAPLAAKAATASIPIVFSTGGDPVQAGLVASYNRPSANVTGITSMNMELGSKRLGLLHELLPKAQRFAVLVVSGPLADPFLQDIQAAASTLGRQVHAYYAANNRDMEAAFGAMAQQQIEAALLSPGALFQNNRVQLAILAARRGLPAIYSSREFADAGGLMSYGPSVAEEFRQTGIYCGRILKGEKPEDLPIMRATAFEFVINLQTARAFGLDVPPSLLARADEVIE